MSAVNLIIHKEVNTIMRIKLEISNPTELFFLLGAFEDRYNKVVHDEGLWDAWELHVQKDLIKQIRKLMEKWGIK